MARRNNRELGNPRRFGSPPSRNADRFSCNRRGKVASAAYSNGTLVVSNRYDHLGRRVQKIAADGTHTFLYDGWRPVVETVATPSGGTDRIEFHWGKATRPPSTPLDGRWR